MSFLSDEVADKECVFRGLVHAMLDRNGNPVTGCLKQSNGVSVDRDGGRTDDEVVRFMDANRPSQRAPFEKFLKMNVGDVRANEWDVKAAPVPGNDYHAEMNEVYPSKHLNQENASAIIKAGKTILKQADAV